MTKPPQKKRLLDEASRRELAVFCDCDPRTIDKILAGKPVRGIAGRRVRERLEAEGVSLPVTAE